MTRITNVDQVLLLIRQQLQRLSTGSGAPSRKSRTDAAQGARRQSALGRLSALGRIEDLAESDLEQSLVRALLTDEFGDGLANDPRFLRVAGEVSRIIASDDETRSLLRQAVRRVRESGP